MNKKKLFNKFLALFLIVFTSLGLGGGAFSVFASSPLAPSYPTFLSATTASCSQINLQWLNNTGEEEIGFEIFQATDIYQVNFSKIRTISPSLNYPHSYSISSLEANKTYCYKIRAFNGYGYSDFSNKTCAQTPVCPAPATVNAPSNLSANAVSSSKINLLWKDNSNNETNFRLVRSSSDTSGAFVPIAVLGANITSYQDTQLGAGIRYCYKVMAYNNSAGSGYSNQSCATTSDNDANHTLTFSANPTSITQGQSSTLSWQAQGASSCVASGGWTGNKSISGTQRVSPSSDATYRITCNWSDGQNLTKSVLVFVNNDTIPVPTLNFSANPTEINPNEYSTLRWNSTGVDYCIASGGASGSNWSGQKPVSHTGYKIWPTETADYTLTCYYSTNQNIVGQNISKTVRVVVRGVSNLTFSANPTSITQGQSSTLSWQAQGASSCVASGGWTGNKSISGTQQVSPNETKTYTLICAWPDGRSVSRSVTINVGEIPPTPPIPPAPPVPSVDPPPGGGCGNNCQPGVVVPPNPGPVLPPSPKINFPNNFCSHDIFAAPLYQAACRVSVGGGANCRMQLGDGFVVQAAVPAEAVNKDAVLRILVQSSSNFPDLSKDIGLAKLIGNKIIQLDLKDENCQKVDLVKDFALTFIYPQAYAQGFNETTFGIKNSPSKSGPMQNVPSGRDISANAVAGLTRNLGYLALFGNPGSNPAVNPTPNLPPINFPTPAPQLFLYSLNVEGPSSDNNWLKLHYLMGSLGDGFKGIDFSWEGFSILLNIILVLIILWAIFGRNLIRNKKKIAPILAGATSAPKKVWHGYIERKASKIKEKRDKMSVSSLLDNKEEAGENVSFAPADTSSLGQQSE